MKYIVIRTVDLATLSWEVDKYLAEDWELQGGISLSVTEPKHTYAQAMVKK
jgi:hypothetical protein